MGWHPSARLPLSTALEEHVFLHPTTQTCIWRVEGRGLLAKMTRKQISHNKLSSSSMALRESEKSPPPMNMSKRFNMKHDLVSWSMESPLMIG